MPETTRTLLAQVDVTEAGTLPPVPAWAVEEQLQRYVEPTPLPADVPWAVTRIVTITDIAVVVENWDPERSRIVCVFASGGDAETWIEKQHAPASYAIEHRSVRLADSAKP